MRPVFPALLALTLAPPALAAAAAEALRSPPDLARGVPYLKARRQMIAAGFEPVRIIYRSFYGTRSPCNAGPDATPCLPELLDCAGHAWSCEWVYARTADGALFSITTHNEGFANRRSDIPRVVSIAPTDPRHLFDSIIAKPPHRDQAPGR